jgi:hypothetical protein
MILARLTSIRGQGFVAHVICHDEDYIGAIFFGKNRGVKKEAGNEE